MADLPELHTLREAATLLRVSPSTLQRQKDLGLLQCTPIGRRLFVSTEQINAYIKAQQRRGNARESSVRVPRALSD